MAKSGFLMWEQKECPSLVIQSNLLLWSFSLQYMSLLSSALCHNSRWLSLDTLPYHIIAQFNSVHSSAVRLWKRKLDNAELAEVFKPKSSLAVGKQHQTLSHRTTRAFNMYDNSKWFNCFFCVCQNCTHTSFTGDHNRNSCSLCNSVLKHSVKTGQGN